jgi:dihydropteroate synthase
MSASSTSPNPSPTDRWLGRAQRWELRTTVLEFGMRPLVMGILNVTPDSFSDGGRFADPERALAHAAQLIEEGADLLDVGGESTRPYSRPVDVDEELRRVMPVLERLCQQTRVPVSIDTSKAVVAERALEAGVEIINDITGLDGDPRMAPVAQQYRAGVCIMHMQGTPQTMQDRPHYENVVCDILAFLRQRRDALVARGLARSRICLDPGVGFGKTHQHNIDLLAACSRFHELECPLLVGPSRKAFIGKVLHDKELERTYGTLGVVLSLARQGVQIVRVHDVAAARQALLLFEATGGIDGCARQL